jgi:tetraacyldisaccharide 4'-kinase
MTRWRDLAARQLNALWYGRSVLRWLLWPLALLFRGLVALRRLAYRRGWIPAVSLPVPVIVVGNLTVGGTGKTPLVIWLARKLGERGLRVGIVCRGYRGSAEHWPQLVDAGADVAQVGDEARLLAQRTGCRVAAGPDRVAAAQALLGTGAIDCLLVDDGLQHYRLRRDFEIAVIDGTRGLGNGMCLPAGPLREPESRLGQVDAIVVNEGSFGHTGVLRASLRARDVVALAGLARKPLAAFSGQSVHAVAAIGNPDRFFMMLRDAGLRVDANAYPDHASFESQDLAFDDDWPVIMTEKDAVKCGHLRQDRLWYVVSDLEFATGDDERLLRRLIRQIERWQMAS